MSRLSTHRATWAVILFVALAARLAAGAWWQSRLPPGGQFYFGDSDSYWQLGRAVAHGGPYEYLTPDARVQRTPGYPILLAGLFLALGDNAPVMAARALSAVLGTIAVGLVGWWATLLFDDRAGRIAGWIAALYPGAISMGALVLAEAPFCPFMLLHLALWGLAWRASDNRKVVALAIAGGAAGGLAALVRPSWLLFAPAALVVALVFDHRRGRQCVIGVSMALGLVVCMLPWWIRNLQVTGRFVATTLQAGASLYDGLNPDADGGSNMDFVPQFVAAERAEQGAAGHGAGEEGDTFEYCLDRRLARASIEWAKAHPARVAELAWIKLVRIWNVWPNEAGLRAWPLRLIVLGTYVPLLTIGLVGVGRYTRWGWPYVLAWLPAVYFTMLHVIFVSSIRYREPAMLALIVLAAGVLAGATRDSPAVEVGGAAASST